MIRHAILASLLALVSSCIDQGQPSNVGTSDQDVTISSTAPIYSNIVPIAWSAREFNTNFDYWAPPVGGVPNLQMVAFVVNGAPAVFDANGNVIVPATRMVWLVSNAGVFRVYEVDVPDVAQMTQTTHNAFTVVENSYAAQGYSTPGSDIIVGVDGGVVIKQGGGGPPHGFPVAVVNTMVNMAGSIRPIIINVQNVGAGSLN
jgi:hypothetical protein